MGEWMLGDVETVLAFDAERCPDPIPAGYQVALVYIGGSSCAHVWDAAELARVEHLPRLPVWVPTPGVDDPRRAAAECVRRCHELGIPPNYNNGVHVRIMWDLETGREPDRGWLEVAAARMRASGYFIAPYLTVSTLLAARTFKPHAGYIVANPTGKPHLYEHPNVEGTQFAFNVRKPGGQIDESALTTGLLAHLWQPARRAA